MGMLLAYRSSLAPPQLLINNHSEKQSLITRTLIFNVLSLIRYDVKEHCIQRVP